MIKIKKLIVVSILTLLCVSFELASAQSVIQKQSLDIFPSPQEGYTQFVIDVPHSDKDNQKKIELFVGKWAETDKCNTHVLSGVLQEKDLQGWGYTFFEFETKGDIMSTMMGCPDSEKINKFVHSQGKVVRYNGKLPLVVYVPEGYEVQYKIWKAEDDIFKALEIKQK